MTGSHTGRRYRIEQCQSFNVVDLGDDSRLCFRPIGHLAPGDIMLAQKVALETDERAALRVANRRR